MKIAHVGKAAGAGKWQAYVSRGEVEAIVYAPTRPLVVQEGVRFLGEGSAEKALEGVLEALESVLGGIHG